VHRILAALAIARNDFERAAQHQEKALGLNPNDDLIVVQEGELLTWLGRAEEGIEWILKAMRLNPFHPMRFWSHLGRAYFVARRYGPARDAFRRVEPPEATHLAFLAAIAAALGDAEAAANYAAELLRQDAAFSATRHLANLHYARDEDRAHHRAALDKAGLKD
jgi:adenylate cyclase